MGDVGNIVTSQVSSPLAAARTNHPRPGKNVHQWLSASVNTDGTNYSLAKNSGPGRILHLTG